MIPGEVFTDKKNIELNADYERISLQVTNKGDRPVFVGAFCPFDLVNLILEFDRKNSVGYRLDIPSGTCIVFEPAETKNITLVKLP